MEQIGDLLHRYSSREPEEITLAKQYIADEFNAMASIAIKGETLVITVTSAALANMLRLRSLQLQKACKTDKRLIFRIA